MSSVQQTMANVEVLPDGRVRVHCRKCGESITLDFGDLDRSGAIERINQLDRTPRECPGYHVELSGWRHFWRLDEAIEAVYGPQQQEGGE